MKSEGHLFFATAGWYQVTARINWQVGRCAFLLEGEDAKGKVYYELPVFHQGVINEILFIKSEVKWLRLTPGIPDISYEVMDMKFCPAGFFKRWRLMIGRIVKTFLTQPGKKIAASGFRFRQLFVAPAEIYHQFRLFCSYTLPINYTDFPAGKDQDGLDLESRILCDGVLVVCLGRIPETLCLEGLNGIKTLCIDSFTELFSFLEKDKAVRYLLFFDSNVTLFPRTLPVFLKRMMAVPKAGLFYSDHDEIDESVKRFTPFFKPDWSPEMLFAQNYVGAVFGVDLERMPVSCLEKSRHLYEILLNVAALTAPIKREGVFVDHIQEILYRCPAKSEDAKRAEFEVLREYFRESAIAAEFEYCSPGFNKIIYPIKGEPLVSIVIPTRDELHHLRRCIESILSKSSYRNFELVIVDNRSSDPETQEYLREINQHQQVSVISYNRPFNFSAINNWAAEQARGEYLCFLNNDTEVIAGAWLQIMLGQLMQPNVGAVGAKLLFENNTVQHVGDAVGVGGVAAHFSLGDPDDSAGYMMRNVIAQDLSAVTGACLLTSRSVYLALSGFNEVDLAVAYNDVDFCLRLAEAGYRVVMTPYAQLYHHESISRGQESSRTRRARLVKENRYMRRRWRHKMNGDPFYNPNLNNSFPDFSINEWYLLQHNRSKNRGVYI